MQYDVTGARSTSRALTEVETSPRKLISAQKRFNQSSWVKDSSHVLFTLFYCTTIFSAWWGSPSEHVDENYPRDLRGRLAGLNQKQGKPHGRKTKANYIYTMTPHWAPRSSKEVKCQWSRGKNLELSCHYNDPPGKSWTQSKSRHQRSLQNRNNRPWALQSEQNRTQTVYSTAHKTCKHGHFNELI